MEDASSSSSSSHADEDEDEDDEEVLRRSFGSRSSHPFRDMQCRFQINRLLARGADNDAGGGADSRRFALRPGDAHRASGRGWELLGRRIAGNRRMESAVLGGLGVDDSKATSLFRGLLDGGGRLCTTKTTPPSLRELDLSNNGFGADGVRRGMAPFLEHSRDVVTEVKLSDSKKIDSECFGLMTAALDGGAVENLRLRGCGIDSIAAMDCCTLPRLRLLDLDHNCIRDMPSSVLEGYTSLEHLWLEGNKIGTEGHRSIARLLQNGSSSLRNLDITYTGMRDEEATMLAESLEFNTSLHRLRVEGNKIGEGGHRAFLTLLNDASSIGRTLGSNHTLSTLELPRSVHPVSMELFYHIGLATTTNRRNANAPHAAGRAKVVETQLNSNARAELCRLQRIDYSYGGIFDEIDPCLLPEVLALVGDAHGRDELYLVMVATAPELASIVDRSGVLRQRMAQNGARKAALTAVFSRQTAALDDEIACLKEELSWIEFVESNR